MNDRLRDVDLERRLTSAFRGGDLPAAPARLLEALERAPDAPVVGGRPGGARSEARRRTTFGLLGIAAVLAVGGALAIGGGGLLRDPSPAPSQGPLPSAAAGTIVTYAVGWTSETPPDAGTLARIVAILEERLAATGSVGVSVRSVGLDRVVVGIPAGLDDDALRELLGLRGETAFVPLGTTAAERGEAIDLVKHPPLFGSEAIADAAVSENGNGLRVVQFTLTPAGASVFGDYTAAHIGEYVAIVLDGKVISAPVINSEIPGGNVEISQDGTIGGYPADAANELVAVLRAGPLPVPLREVSSEPGPVEPAVVRPSPPESSAAQSDPNLASPALSPGTFELERIVGDLGCDSVIPPYIGFSLQIDPTADHPVTAATETGLRLPVLWGPEFHGSAGPPPIVIDGRGHEYGPSAYVRVRGVPTPALDDHFVCAAPDSVYVFNEPPPA